jgi:TonB family protein
MDSKIYNHKRIFRLDIRIGFMITLVAFILGFMFIPEFGKKPYQYEVRTIIRIDKLNPPVDIVRIPPPPRLKFPVAAKSDKEVEEETIATTNFTDDGKIAGIELKDFFVVYEVPPEPLNLNKIQFPYPEVARRLGITGTVFLELWIDKEGAVKNVILTKSVYPTLDKVAIENAWKLKFSPAMQRDKPVAVRYSFPVKFTLE